MPIESGATAADFEERLRSGERWLDLSRGRLVRLEPPDELHGNVVYHVAKLVASSVRSNPQLVALFDVGLWVEQAPDTVHCPAVSCFLSNSRFAQTDQLLTTDRPEFVMEIGSTPDRRDAMAERIEDYRKAEIPEIWMVDCVTRHVHVHRQGERSRMLKPQDILAGTELLPTINIEVKQLFIAPPWAR